MQIRKKPPGRMSDSCDVTVKPRGATCQCCRCSGLVQHSKTSSRGASNRRVMTSSFCADSVTAPAFALLAAMFLLLLFQFAQILIQPIKTFVPEAAIVLHPFGDVLEWAWLDPAGS